MTCPQCRFQNPDEALFCANCGLAFQQGQGAPYAPASGPLAPKQGLAITSLVLGIASWPLVCAFGLGYLTALVGVVLGIVALVKAGRAPGEYGGKGLAIGGLAASGLLFLSLPIMAAIAIPSLLRARVSANEAGTIGDIRTVISAEAAYASANGNYYDTLECLQAPAQCIPNYPASAPTFLDASTAAAVKSGYKRTFHAGPRPGHDEATAAISPTSVKSFAFVAVPATRNQTGVRGFCGDDTGRICVTTDGSPPPVENGQCSASCTMLQ